jgi:hypothetical protein
MADASIKVVLGASIPHIVSTSAGSMAAGAISSATSGASLSALVGSANLSSYPRCDVVLRISNSLTTSSTAMNINLYRRDINVGGVTNFDNAIPGVNNSNTLVGSFPYPATASGDYYIDAIDVPLPCGNTDCEFYIGNGLTGTIAANVWSLTVFPKTDVGSTA